MARPVTLMGKTVAVEVMGKTEVEVIPESRSTVGAEKDFPHYSTLSSGEARLNVVINLLSKAFSDLTSRLIRECFAWGPG